MRCPICGNETLAVTKLEQTRDGHALWGCLECKLGQKPDLAETLSQAMQITTNPLKAERAKE